MVESGPPRNAPTVSSLVCQLGGRQIRRMLDQLPWRLRGLPGRLFGVIAAGALGLGSGAGAGSDGSSGGGEEHGETVCRVIRPDVGDAVAAAVLGSGCDREAVALRAELCRTRRFPGSAELAHADRASESAVRLKAAARSPALAARAAVLGLLLLAKWGSDA